MKSAAWGVVAGMVLVLGVGGTAWWMLRGGRAAQTVAPAAPASLPAASPAPVSAAAGLYFPQTTVEVAAPPDATHAVVEFPFENRSGGRVEIASVERNCSCVRIAISDNGKLVYEPGEGGVIRAEYELGNQTGLVEKPFNLYLKGDPPERATHRLTPRIRIAALLEISEKTLKWDLDGPAMPQRTELRVVGTQPVRVLSATSSQENMAVQLKELEPGRRYEVSVTPAATTRPALALIRIETDSTISRWKAQQVFALIQAPNRVMPKRQ